ncbi:GntP family permease [Corynebacterium glyciniphilum]|uniref:H+/gluconate symporter family protein n=1 Tax=Corynebacterium glyciniphilum AJ 3170 TaxID=1404245 RepID=X5DTP9_9CORY|nr:GntP family permease [Corynebacterium glyciniphilum]AHW64654.1 H+/gluconate symporter family protein [Corynebacterium glyciniphilum AJ 3170]
MVLASIGVILALLVLIVLAYRGHSVIVAAPIAALIGVLFSGAPLMASYTQIFMPAAGNFIVNFFPLFLVGAIFGTLMSASGYADHLAQWISRLVGAKKAILATAIATALLTYGGISAWVIAFTIVPVANSLFREANIPRRLMPAAIALGIFTFATAALPGSPQIHNAIPTRYFGTTTYAAPVFGIIGAIVTFVLGMAWLEYRTRKLVAAGEVYEEPSHQETTVATTMTTTSTSTSSPSRWPDRATTLLGLRGLLPILIVVGMNLLFVYVLSKKMDFAYLAEDKFGNTDIGAVMGTWSVVIAMATAILAIFLMKPGMFSTYIKGLSDGAKNAVVPAFTTASEVGFGAVIASLAVFAALQNSIFDVSNNPVVIGAVATAVISGLTGSSSGGLTITLETFGDQLAQMATDQGISLELLHRVIAMASVSFDSLPHNGAIVTLLLVCGLTHRQSYKDVGMVTIVPPLIGVLVVMGLGAVFPTI